MYRLTFFLTLCLIVFGLCSDVWSADFNRSVRPLLDQYCVSCHCGDDANGGVDFSAVKTADDVYQAYETWDAVLEHLRAGTMPPEDSDQPNDEERAAFFLWYDEFYANIEARPVVQKPRRLSVMEYRNTLESVFGFKIEVAIMEAEQTVAEKSLVLKLLPTDPPGRSGFKNDTHRNPLSSNAWDQYSFLTDTAIERLFSAGYRQQLESFTGPVDGDGLSAKQAESLLREILARSRRRPVAKATMDKALTALEGKTGTERVVALKLELKQH